jgi:DivIVA domain-containing protein
MEWFIAAVAVVALGVAAVVAAGGGGSMPKEPVRDTYAMTLPEEPLDGDGLRRLRFGIALRGYAMDQVDDVLDRLAAELDARDARVAELSAELATARGGAAGAGGTTRMPSPAATTEASGQPR